MFKSYKSIGLQNNILSYEIVDDDFVDINTVAVSKSNMGRAVEISIAAINTYEARGLDVCTNLLLALRWSSETHSYQLTWAMKEVYDDCLSYKKYATRFGELLAIGTNIKCKLCDRHLLNRGFTQECTVPCAMPNGTVESHYTYTDKGKSQTFRILERFILFGHLVCCNIETPDGKKYLKVFNRSTVRSNKEDIFDIKTRVPIEDFAHYTEEKFLEKLQTYQLFT